MIADRHDISTKQSLQGEFYIFLIGGHYDNDRLTVLQDKVYKEIFYIYQGGYYDNDRLTVVTLFYKEIFFYLSRGVL